MVLKFRIRYMMIVGMIFSSVYISIAQVKKENPDYNKTYLPQGRDPHDPVYYFVDEMPTIEGGIKALREFIRQAPYPECGYKDTIQRLVVLQFVVEKDGSLSDMQVLRSPNTCYLKAATLYMQQQPQWSPCKRNGEIVPCLYTLPISYQFKNQ